MKVQEQIDCVYNAGLFISQHGAGITNATFMKPGSRVIEIIQYSYRSYDAYRLLSETAGINYTKHIIPDRYCSGHTILNQNIIINASKLKNEI